jgi:hypothetical protein
VDAPGLVISGLTSSSISTNSGDTLRSATDTERVLDRDLADGAGLFRLEGVVDGSIVGGGVGARSENSFSFKRTTSVRVVDLRK